MTPSTVIEQVEAVMTGFIQSHHDVIDIVEPRRPKLLGFHTRSDTAGFSVCTR